MLDQIHPKNKNLVERFLKSKKASCAETTIIGYKSDLDIFMCWNVLYNENKFYVDLKKIEIAEFFDFTSEELRWSSSRFARMKSALSSFAKAIV